MGTNEIWAPVIGTQNKYFVSNFGRVRSQKSRLRLICNAMNQERVYLGKLMKPYIRNGYELIFISCKNKKRWRSLHRMVLESFIGWKPFPEYEANHLDGRKRNNRLDNLEWCSKSQNMKHAYQRGLCRLPEQTKEMRDNARKRIKALNIGFKLGHPYYPRKGV